MVSKGLGNHNGFHSTIRVSQSSSLGALLSLANNGLDSDDMMVGDQRKSMVNTLIDIFTNSSQPVDRPTVSGARGSSEESAALL